MLFIDTVKIDSDLLDFCLAAFLLKLTRSAQHYKIEQTQRKDSLNNIYPSTTQGEFAPKMGTKVIQWKAKAISLSLSLGLHGTGINQYSPTKQRCFRFRVRFRSV